MFAIIRVAGSPNDVRHCWPQIFKASMEGQSDARSGLLNFQKISTVSRVTTDILIVGNENKILMKYRVFGRCSSYRNRLNQWIP